MQVGMALGCVKSWKASQQPVAQGEEKIWEGGRTEPRLGLAGQREVKILSYIEDLFVFICNMVCV